MPQSQGQLQPQMQAQAQAQLQAQPQPQLPPGGQLVPAEIVSLEDHDELDFALDELRLTIRVCGEVAAQPIMSVVGQFAGEGGAGRPITVAGLGGLIFMLDGDQPLGAWDERGWIAELKARITELYAQAATSGFLAHAALLSRDGRGLLVCGEPGDGKTTLSIALAAHGFGHHADDIVRIDETGHATGAPFAPALKSGAWTLLGEIVPGLDDLPIYLRGDGQEVRYLPVAAAIRPSLPIGAVLLLNRQSGGPAAIEPVEPMQVLTAILGSAYSPRGAIDAQTLQALADAVNGARLGRLTYAGLDEAVRAVDAFFR